MSKMLSKPRICIYVVGHKPFNLPVKDCTYIPLMVGNQCQNCPKGWLSDSSGDNISDKNDRYNELTGLYWIWKNSKADIVGLCHYRRFFTTPIGKLKNVLTGRNGQFISGDYIEKVLTSYDVILHNKTFTLNGNQNQLCMKEAKPAASQIFKLRNDILDIVDESFRTMYSEDYLFYKRIMNRRYAHLLNIMICHKETLNQYCEWLFPLLFKIETEIDQKFPGQKHLRCMGMIAERLLDVWVLTRHLRVKECFTINTERIDWKFW